MASKSATAALAPESVDAACTVASVGTFEHSAAVLEPAEVGVEDEGARNVISSSDGRPSLGVYHNALEPAE